MDRIALGRKLGATARVAGRMIAAGTSSARVNPPGESQPPSAPSAPPKSSPPAGPPSIPKTNHGPAEIGRKAATAVRGTRIGAQRFGEAVWGPFIHAGRVLWLEVTGLFFALFATWFITESWQRRADALHGPEHQHFVLYAAVAVVFLYFSFSSFMTAWRRGPKK